MRAVGRIGMFVLAGALSLAGCDRGEPPAEAPAQADGAIPPGAIPAAPEVEPGAAASAAPAAAPASAAPGDSAARANGPGAGQTSQADTGAAPPAGAPQQ